MKAPKFERNKIQRLLNTSGVEYTFKRDIVDEFREATGTADSMTLVGVYHETTQHVSVVGTDAASVQSKQTPYILTLYEYGKDIKQGDYTFIDGVKYTVTGANDVNKWHIAVDISLEHDV